MKGEVFKTPLFNQDYNDALTFAESDLKSNWKYWSFWSYQRRNNPRWVSLGLLFLAKNRVNTKIL